MPPHKHPSHHGIPCLGICHEPWFRAYSVRVLETVYYIIHRSTIMPEGYSPFKEVSQLLERHGRLIATKVVDDEDMMWRQAEIAVYESKADPDREVA